MNELPVVPVVPIEEYHLDKETELRFEVEEKSVEVTLVAGKAEIFGTVLVLDETYTFSPGSKMAIYTWFGCTVKIAGKTECAYIGSETPMVVYSNIHACLEKLRLGSETNFLPNKQKERGPVTLVVGPPDVGKTTLCRILLNYAVRRGRRPIYVDLDAEQGSISVPGTIGAIMVSQTANVDEGFSQEAPLVYNFGSINPSDNMTLYEILLSQLAEAINLKMESNSKIDSSGVVINTCGWVSESGYNLLKYIAQCFEIDVVLVLDQERLFNQLVTDLGPFGRVVYIPKSSGIVESSREIRIKAKEDRIRNYFYGQRTKYTPHMLDIPYSQMEIYKIGVPSLPDSCMPVDMKVEDPLTKIVKVQPSQKIVHNLLAVSLARTQENILTCNVAAFICVMGVNEDTKMVSILSTQPKHFPNKLLVQTNIIFKNSH